jgi:hypothetical protein
MTQECFYQRLRLFPTRNGQIGQRVCRQRHAAQRGGVGNGGGAAHGIMRFDPVGGELLFSSDCVEMSSL